MRFLKDGPSIPDDLLIARDEGRVVFFVVQAFQRRVQAFRIFSALRKR